MIILHLNFEFFGIVSLFCLWLMDPIEMRIKLLMSQLAEHLCHSDWQSQNYKLQVKTPPSKLHPYNPFSFKGSETFSVTVRQIPGRKKWRVNIHSRQSGTHSGKQSIRERGRRIRGKKTYKYSFNGQSLLFRIVWSFFRQLRTLRSASLLFFLCNLKESFKSPGAVKMAFLLSLLLIPRWTAIENNQKSKLANSQYFL